MNAASKRCAVERRTLKRENERLRQLLADHLSDYELLREGVRPTEVV